jgi:hypothetical protein
METTSGCFALSQPAARRDGARALPFLLGALLLAHLAAPAAAQKTAVPPYRLALRAMLFYNDRGTFSGDIIAHPVDLWNTPVGEGRAGGASNATLVVVQVTGQPGSYLPDRKVELTVTSRGRTVFQRTQETSVLNVQGHTSVGFWLYETGCQRLRLSARVIGQQPANAVTATIPFACGE